MPRISFANVVWAEVGVTSDGRIKMQNNYDGKYRYVARGSVYYNGTSVVQAGVVGSNGAKSVGTVNTTISAQVSKKTVFRHVLNNARIYGKMGLKRAGWLGVAYSLAEMALMDNGYKWSDEKGDFVKNGDDNTYVVFATEKPSFLPSFQEVTDSSLEKLCQGMNCSIIGHIRGIENANERALSYCKSLTFKSGSENLHFDSIGWSGSCFSQEKNVISSKGVKVYKYADYVPITQDQFDKIVEKIADLDPTKWVEASRPAEDADVPGLSKPKATVADGEIAQSPPYTDPKTGKAQQTRWEFNTPENGTPTVSEIIIPRPDLTPDSPEAPPVDDKDIPKDDDQEDTAEVNDNGGQQPPQEPFDLCKEHPDVLACDKQPEKPDEQDFEIKNETVNLFFEPDTIFPTAGVCPAPISFRVEIPFAGAKTFEFDTTPVCEIAIRLRNLLIAIAWLVTAVFCFRSFSKGS